MEIAYHGKKLRAVDVKVVLLWIHLPHRANVLRKLAEEEEKSRTRRRDVEKDVEVSGLEEDLWLSTGEETTTVLPNAFPEASDVLLHVEVNESLLLRLVERNALVVEVEEKSVGDGTLLVLRQHQSLEEGDKRRHLRHAHRAKRIETVHDGLSLRRVLQGGRLLLLGLLQGGAIELPAQVKG